MPTMGRKSSRVILAVASGRGISMMDKVLFDRQRRRKARSDSMRRKTTTFAFVFFLLAWSGYVSASRGEDSRDPSHFTYARLYCAPDGNTHFEDVTVDLRKTNFAPPAPPINIGSDFAASRAFFGGFDAGWGAQDLEKKLNHPTPAMQFGIVLQGSFSISTTDGETRRLPPGSVFRLEDTSPCKGHITVVGDQPGFLMFVR
jgi:hypothetical protein